MSLRAIPCKLRYQKSHQICKTWQEKNAKEKTEHDIAEALKVSDQQNHTVGEKLPQDQCVYRVKVVTVFLQAAIPLNKIDNLEIYWRRMGIVHLTGDMSGIVPFISSQEQALIKEELAGRDLSVIFDRSICLGRAMAILVRFIDSNWQIQQRLIRFQLLAQSMTGEQVARELIMALLLSTVLAPAPSYHDA